jgi:GH24 family phage-related lysozyme (muramidase)
VKRVYIRASQKENPVPRPLQARVAAGPTPTGYQPNVHALQRALGNRTVGRLLRAGVIQARLRVGQPDDKYEREADRMAEQVMRMAEPGDLPAKVARDQVTGPAYQTPDLITHVRAGKFAPNTQEGNELTGHETTHVVQQSSQVMDGNRYQALRASPAPSSVIQRQTASGGGLIQSTDPDLLQFTLRFEGLIPYIYADSKGLPTIGIGHLLQFRNQSREDGLRETLRIHRQYGFQKRALASGSASEAEVRAEFNRLMDIPEAARKNKSAATYWGPRATIELSEASCKSLKQGDARAKITGLQNQWPGGRFEDLPKSVQIALVDMAFNTGVRGLCTYSRHADLRTGVNNGDWETAARAIVDPARSGISRAVRNRARADLLRS